MFHRYVIVVIDTNPKPQGRQGRHDTHLFYTLFSSGQLSMAKIRSWTTLKLTGTYYKSEIVKKLIVDQ